jgi:hypothetical protein
VQQKKVPSLISIGFGNRFVDYRALANAQSRQGAFCHISAISKRPLSYIVSDQKAEFQEAGHFRHGGSELRVAW